MVSKNNRLKRFEQSAQRQNHFGIRKLTIGAASVLLGTSLYLGTQTSQAKAATVDGNNKDNAEQQSGEDKSVAAKDVDHVEVAKQATTLQVAGDQATTENKAQQPAAEVKTDAVKQATDTAKAEEKANEATNVENKNAQVENKITDANKEQETKAAKTATTTTLKVASFKADAKANKDTKDPILAARMLTASKVQATAKTANADANTDASKAKNNYQVVTDEDGFKKAVNSNAQGVNVKGNITVNSDLNINKNFAIVGADEESSLNFGNSSLNNSGNLTLQNITVNGSVMGDGTVNISGKVVSNVNSANSSVPTQNQYTEQNYTGARTNFKNSNISASNVNIENGASLTINSTEINDGINLRDGGTVRVGDNATLNVNLTNASTTATRYHVAGVFAKNGGNFISGYQSNVNFNTGLGQAISIGATRPAVTDSERFGGYGARSRNDGPTLVQLGESSTFNFTGRDGIILGNNANFVSGENSNVHFENKGRGVALDLANNSNIEISKHSNTYFHSVGKTGTSGSYDGYNYIGVNEGGNITVDEYATFRVILEGRGDNPWDDVVSLDSQNSNTNAAFTSKTGAIIDIRDDNTNFYAELISFPLGSSNSRIDIHDPLMLNLQRYSKGGATTGWMATGGDMINTTSSQYTSNLIYMSGSKGVFSVDGTDYVVYQKIKSDGSKQIWLNVNGVNIPMSGFQTKDMWNNKANPDLSIKGNGLTGDIKANQVHNFDGSPLTGKDAPYYGISTQRASHQIWFPHKTQMEVVGKHTNTIKYVDEQGNQLFPDATQDLNLTRKLTLDITQDKIKEIQDYALSHTADETLEYIKNAQGVSQDSGWIYTDAQGNVITNPYAQVISPVKDGYTTSIESSNVPGITVGSDGKSVTAKLQYKEDLVQNGELSKNYKQNGLSAILPDNYETVVVYKKAQDAKITVNYVDQDANNKVLHTDSPSGKIGDAINYSTKTEIETLTNQGYVLVTDGYNAGDNFTADNNGKTYTVVFKHGQIPVGPDTPDKHGVDPSQVEKNVKETVHYVYANGTKAADDNVQNSKWTRTVTVDAVTNEVVPNGQYTTEWAIAKGQPSEYSQVNSPVIKGYYADQANVPATKVTQDDIEKKVIYKPLGHIVPVDPTTGKPIPNAPQPQFPNDPTDPTKGNPGEKPNVPGFHPETGKPGDKVTPNPGNPGEDVKVPYVKDQGTVSVIFHDDTSDSTIPNVGFNSGDTAADTPVTYNPEKSISDLEKQGYVYVRTEGTLPDKVEANKNITVTVHMKHGVQPVDPNTPPTDVPKNTPKEAQPDALTKKVNLTVNYVNADGTTFTGTVPANAKQTAVFTGTAYVDKITGQLVNAKQEDGKWVIDTDNNATPSITWTSNKTSFEGVTSPSEVGYHVTNVSEHADGNNVAAITGLTKDSQDITVTVTYTKNGTDLENKQHVPASQTVQYVDDQGNTLLADKEKNFEFTYSGDTVDKVTGETIEHGLWNKTSHNFTAEEVPVIDGYVAVSGYTKTDDGKYTAGGFTATNTGSKEDNNKVFKVVYKKVGNIVPQDPEGNPIPDPNKPGETVPNVPYKNDPTDPTKVTPNEKTPDIPGWHTDTPNVTPTDPTKDTPVVYTKNVENQNVTVKYFDDTKETDLSSYDKSISAKPGEALNYSTQPSITELENKGYKLVSDNFNVTTMPEKGGNYEVHFVHNTTTITPDKPGKPGEPINPNDPNGPKWPEGTDAKNLTKQGTQTVHYVYADGTKAANDNVQNTTFAHTLVFDNVTGKQIEDKGWTPESHKFNDVTSPEIDGYHADKKTVNGATVTVDDPTSETIVVYAKNDTEIRNKQEVKASQVVKYQDEDGNELSPSKSQNFTFKYTGDTYDAETGKQVATGKWINVSYDFDSEDVPIVEGYVAVKGYTRDDNDKVVAGGFTTTYDATDAKRNRTFVVVYKKVGKIIPVDPSKNPIPDAPTPSYKNDPTDPTKVTPDEPTPNVPGYTPSQNTVTPPDPTKDTPVVYTKNVEQKAKVQYIDLDDNNKVMSESPVLTGQAGDKIDYSTTNEIANYEKQGYVLADDGFSNNPVFDNVEGNEQIFKVTFHHGQAPVNPDHPHDGVDPSEYTKEVKETVHYVGAGDKTPADSVQTSKWTRTLTVDTVTGKVIENGRYTTDWSIAKGEKTVYDQVNTPVVDGYYADQANIPATAVTQDNIEKTVTYKPMGHIIPVDPTGKPIPNVPTPQFPNDPTDPTKGNPGEKPNIPGFHPESGNPGDPVSPVPGNPGEDVKVPYVPDVVAKDQNAVVNYVDADDNNSVITSSGNLTGKAGAKIDYSTQSTITSLENQGYELVHDGFPTGATYDNDDNTTQTYTVVLKHGHQPVNPNEPGKPGEPINPNDPNGPKYPDDTDKTSLTHDVTRTIQYAGLPSDQTPANVEQTVHFTASGVLDKVTGQWITPLTWSSDQTVNNVVSPTVPGYHVTNVSADTTDGKNVDSKTLNHKDSSYTVTVTYTKDDAPVVQKGSITVTVHDVTTDTDLPDYGKQSGEQNVGTKFEYDKPGTIEDLTNKGYKVINPDVTIPTEITDGPHTTVIYVEHNIIPVTPDKPGNGLTDKDLEKDVTRTVTYEGLPTKPSDVTDTLHFTGTGYYDAVTKKWTDADGKELADQTKAITWTSQDGTKFSGVTSPFNKDYHIVSVTSDDGQNYNDGKGSVTAITGIGHNSKNIHITVTYAQNGKIIPVDPYNKPIPDAPTPTYPTDPTDPTKVVPNEPVPEIPGMTPSTPTVTPTDPGKDTPVPYTPVTPAKDQVAQVIYRDVQNGANTQLATSGNLSGKAGSEINYSTADTIKKLTDQGYVLKNDGFPAGAVFDNDDSKTQTFYVDFVHGQAPVNPDHPHDGVDPSEYTKEVKETVHYEGAGDKTPADSVQTSKWTRTLTVDTVTGKVIENGQYDTDWSIAKGEKTVYDQVNTPVVDGYHADKREVPATAVTQDNITVTVTYTQNGKIIPVGPDGKTPIPNVPTPTYPTDPTDPTKVVPDEPVPEIPGMIPSTPTVTPKDPGKDTPVPYNPVTPAKDQNAVVNYVDADNNNSVITSSGNLTGKAEEKINYSTKSTIDDLINKGYVLVHDGFPADAKFDNDDNTTQTFTVVLKHGLVPVTPENPGKPGEPINPNDPNGPKWPEGTDENSVKRTGTQTIHYTGAGNNTPKDDVQQFDFTKKMVVDKVTGKIVDGGQWNVTSHTFGYKDTPVVEGYHADRRNAGGSTVTPDDLNKQIVVTYTKNGKIIPVDPTGKPIPDAPTPTYPTDPTDPTKVKPDEPVPSIPGYKPSVPTVTPTDPGKDTPVPYVPEAQAVAGKVTYIDDTTGSILKSDEINGKVGDKINYTTADKITNYINQGYELVSNDFKDGNETFAKEGNNFEVHLKHGTTTITPDKPGNPGQPINPNDPNGPKWGDDTDAKHLRRTGTQTVHYQGAGSNTPADNVTTVVFDHSITIDKVTGKTVKDNGWTPATNTYVTVTTPQIDGYTASVNQVGGDTVKSTDGNIDRNYTVTYTVITPNTPVDPTPVPQPQPEPTPDQPETPAEPDIPAPHGEDVPTAPEQEPDIPAPHGEDVPDAEPVAPQVQKVSTNEEPAPAPHASELPQTGSEDDNAAAIAGASIALIGLTGLIGAAKRRRKN
ncbi:mucin-binding protein [Lactobacillus hominis]|uniref:mucin-binding protein n=1 Tax=Lactobacillus hominis TaxID=1203033 RepID=UPI0026084E28|nr:YSIRK-type signal peptide-containing protein [Lactobacillus hominis]